MIDLEQDRNRREKSTIFPLYPEFSRLQKAKSLFCVSNSAIMYHRVANSRQGYYCILKIFMVCSVDSGLDVPTTIIFFFIFLPKTALGFSKMNKHSLITMAKKYVYICRKLPLQLLW